MVNFGSHRTKNVSVRFDYAFSMPDYVRYAYSSYKW